MTCSTRFFPSCMTLANIPGNHSCRWWQLLHQCSPRSCSPGHWTLRNDPTDQCQWAGAAKAATGACCPLQILTEHPSLTLNIHTGWQAMYSRIKLSNNKDSQSDRLSIQILSAELTSNIYIYICILKGIRNFPLIKETTFPFSEGNNGMRKYNFSLNVDIGKEAPKKKIYFNIRTLCPQSLSCSSDTGIHQVSYAVSFLQGQILSARNTLL